jgi:hypothetical protein
MVPMLPCGDIDDMARFWTPLGLSVTYRQLRPNPYLALRRNAIELHYYGMDDVDPEQSYSSCSIVVPDTAPLHELFVKGLRSAYGRVPLTGLPRITRPRLRANNAGLSGFSLIDPAGNWIRVSRRAEEGQEPRAVDDRTAWVSAGGGALARALENAVVLADSHGDEAQAHRSLSGAVQRHADGPVAERVAAWAYLAELRLRLRDRDGARQAVEHVRAVARTRNLTPQEREAVELAVREIAELPLPTD